MSPDRALVLAQQALSVERLRPGGVPGAAEAVDVIEALRAERRAATRLPGAAAVRARFAGLPDAEIMVILERRLADAHRETQAARKDVGEPVKPGPGVPTVEESAVYAYKILMKNNPQRGDRFHAGELLYTALRGAGVEKEVFDASA